MGKMPTYRFSSTVRTEDSGGGGDVMVVEEKLTYVNIHAKLAVDVTLRLVNEVETLVRSRGVQIALMSALEKTKAYYTERLCREEAAESEVALESFVAYLLKNRCACKLYLRRMNLFLDGVVVSERLRTSWI